jgi:CxxC motif-containing protein
MRELTCIVCPIGCSLLIEEGPPAADGLPVVQVSGNRCPRGAVYAQEEIRSPKRVVTATCGIGDGLHSPCGIPVMRRVPVKSNVPCPKEKIPALLADIYKTAVNLPVKAGDTVIANWQNCGIDVVVTRNIA